MPTSTVRGAVPKSPRPKARRRTDDRDALPPMPVEKTNLTPTERALLADPNYVTEDEADWIICERRLRKEGHKAIPFEEVLREYGRQPRRRVAS